MKFPAFVLSLALAAYTSGAVVERADTDKSDWKYAVGWDGVTLPADAIGDAVAVSNTTSDLEVCSMFSAYGTQLTVPAQKRATGGVYICTDVGWGGRCGYAVQPVHKCIVLGSDWSNQISSFGPDQCTSCLAYTYVSPHPG